MFQMELTQRAAQHLGRLAELGYDVKAVDRFDEVEALVRETGKPLRSPMFDLRRNDFTEGRAFWFFLLKDGKPVGGLAAKLIELGDEGFEDYVKRVSGPQFGEGHALKEVARPIRARMSGDLIYFGELHVMDGARGQRRVLREYSRLAVALAAMNWPRFDWMYALIPYEQRSLQDLYGFPLITHGAFLWQEPVPYLHKNDQAMIYISRMDLRHQLAIGEPD